MEADAIRAEAIDRIARGWYEWWRKIFDGHSVDEHPAPPWDEVPDDFGAKREWQEFAAEAVDALGDLLPTIVDVEETGVWGVDLPVRRRVRYLTEWRTVVE